jgi:hypothetical protein
MRSGDTMAATLVDLKAAGFEIQVNGSDRMIAKDQVAMVDFGGTVTVKPESFKGISPMSHLVVFKNGDTLMAEWTDVGGTSPLILRFGSGQNEREISAAQVARIYLAAPAATSESTTPAGGTDGEVAVMANTQWTSAGITVRTGEFLRFRVSGQIHFGTGADDIASADGNGGARVTAPFRTLPVRSLPVGGLIGRVGNGAAFSIGSAPEAIRMPANGQLFLGINDLTFNDNSGSFRVLISRGR